MARKAKPKQPPQAPPPGHVLRTNAEIADWLFTLDRRRKLKRVARCEAQCQVILAQPPSDPRHPHVARMQELLVVARGNLEQGHPADWQLVEIERLGGAMNTLYLGRHLTTYVGGKQSKGDLWELMAGVDAAMANRRSPLEVMRAVVHSGRLTGARIIGTRLHYQDPPGRDRSIGLNFRVKLAAVRQVRPEPSKEPPKNP